MGTCSNVFTQKASPQHQDQPLHQHVQELERQLHLIKTQKQNLQQRIDAQETDNQNLQQRMRVQETDNQNLQQRIHAQETDILNLQQRIRAQETELQNLRQERQDNQRLLQQQQQQIHQLQQNQQQHNTLQQQQTWIVNRKEISLEEKELGRGAYGWVKQGTFRGCKVAVKCLHNELISEYNLHVFDREMTMAARCRHPAVHRSH